MLDILNSTRTADIAPALKSLRIDERDTLMKYLYRGLEVGRTSGSSVNCAVLLSWHEKVCGVYSRSSRSSPVPAALCGS